MILQELVKCYEELRKQKLVPEQHFASGKITFKLDITLDGKINYFEAINQYDQKRKIYPPISIIIPAPVSRSSDISANFIVDNPNYIIGFETKGKPEAGKKKFNETKRHHNEILKDINCEAATALKNFFNKWEPDEYKKHIPEAYIKYLSEPSNTNAKIIFSYKNQFLTEIKEITDAWKKYKNEHLPKEIGQCLVTGEITNLVPKHPPITNLKGALVTGASLISFNDNAYESYGLKRNQNAPIGVYASFACATALNYMLSNNDYKITIGDTTIVFWADNSEKQYSRMFKKMMGQQIYEEVIGQQIYEDAEEQQKYLKQILDTISMKKPLSYNNEVLNGNIKFNILGLTPNLGRASVKFFYKDNYNKFFDNIKEHYDDFSIAKPEYEKFKFLPLWLLIQEIIGQSKQILLTEKIITSIFNNTLYPDSMLLNTIVRINRENDKPANSIYASIIKGYLTRYNKKFNKDKEMFTMALNPECKDIPYILGRLFAVYEHIQDLSANGNTNATIKSRFFNICMTNPVIGYPIIGKLSINHLHKLNTPLAIKMEKKLGALLDLLEKEDGKTIFPKRLNLQQQGEYYLGYYHETQKRYEKKENKENE